MSIRLTYAPATEKEVGIIQAADRQERRTRYWQRVLPFVLEMSMGHRLALVSYSKRTGFLPDPSRPSPIRNFPRGHAEGGKPIVIRNKKEIMDFMERKGRFEKAGLGAFTKGLVTFFYIATASGKKNRFVLFDFDIVDISETTFRPKIVEICEYLEKDGFDALPVFTGSSWHIWAKYPDDRPIGDYGGIGPPATGVVKFIVDVANRFDMELRGVAAHIRGRVTVDYAVNRANSPLRFPLSLHHKTGLVAVPLKKEEVMALDPKEDAHPEVVLEPENLEKYQDRIRAFFSFNKYSDSVKEAPVEFEKFHDILKKRERKFEDLRPGDLFSAVTTISKGKPEKRYGIVRRVERHVILVYAFTSGDEDIDTALATYKDEFERGLSLSIGKELLSNIKIHRRDMLYEKKEAPVEFEKFRDLLRKPVSKDPVPGRNLNIGDMIVDTRDVDEHGRSIKLMIKLVYGVVTRYSTDSVVGPGGVGAIWGRTPEEAVAHFEKATRAERIGEERYDGFATDAVRIPPYKIVKRRAVRMDAPEVYDAKGIEDFVCMLHPTLMLSHLDLRPGDLVEDTDLGVGTMPSRYTVVQRKANRDDRPDEQESYPGAYVWGIWTDTPEEAVELYKHADPEEYEEFEVDYSVAPSKSFPQYTYHMRYPENKIYRILRRGIKKGEKKEAPIDIEKFRDLVMRKMPLGKIVTFDEIEAGDLLRARRKGAPAWEFLGVVYAKGRSEKAARELRYQPPEKALWAMWVDTEHEPITDEELVRNTRMIYPERLKMGDDLTFLDPNEPGSPFEFMLVRRGIKYGERTLDAPVELEKFEKLLKKPKVPPVPGDDVDYDQLQSGDLVTVILVRTEYVDDTEAIDMLVTSGVVLHVGPNYGRDGHGPDDAVWALWNNGDDYVGMDEGLENSKNNALNLYVAATPDKLNPMGHGGEVGFIDGHKFKFRVWRRGIERKAAVELEKFTKFLKKHVPTKWVTYEDVEVGDLVEEVYAGASNFAVVVHKGRLEHKYGSESSLWGFWDGLEPSTKIKKEGPQTTSVGTVDEAFRVFYKAQVHNFHAVGETDTPYGALNASSSEHNLYRVHRRGLHRFKLEAPVGKKAAPLDLEKYAELMTPMLSGPAEKILPRVRIGDLLRVRFKQGAEIGEAGKLYYGVVQTVERLHDDVRVMAYWNETEGEALRRAGERGGTWGYKEKRGLSTVRIIRRGVVVPELHDAVGVEEYQKFLKLHVTYRQLRRGDLVEQIDPPVARGMAAYGIVYAVGPIKKQTRAGWKSEDWQDEDIVWAYWGRTAEEAMDTLKEGHQTGTATGGFGPYKSRETEWRILKRGIKVYDAAEFEKFTQLLKRRVAPRSGTWKDVEVGDLIESEYEKEHENVSNFAVVVHKGRLEGHGSENALWGFWDGLDPGTKIKKEGPQTTTVRTKDEALRVFYKAQVHNFHVVADKSTPYGALESSTGDDDIYKIHRRGLYRFDLGPEKKAAPLDPVKYVDMMTDMSPKNVLPRVRVGDLIKVWFRWVSAGKEGAPRYGIVQKVRVLPDDVQVGAFWGPTEEDAIEGMKWVPTAWGYKEPNGIFRAKIIRRASEVHEAADFEKFHKLLKVPPKNTYQVYATNDYYYWNKKVEGYDWASDKYKFEVRSDTLGTFDTFKDALRVFEGFDVAPPDADHKRVWTSVFITDDITGQLAENAIYETKPGKYQTEMRVDTKFTKEVMARRGQEFKAPVELERFVQLLKLHHPSEYAVGDVITDDGDDYPYGVIVDTLGAPPREFDVVWFQDYDEMVKLYHTRGPEKMFGTAAQTEDQGGGTVYYKSHEDASIEKYRFFRRLGRSRAMRVMEAMDIKKYRDLMDPWKDEFIGDGEFVGGTKWKKYKKIRWKGEKYDTDTEYDWTDPDFPREDDVSAAEDLAVKKGDEKENWPQYLDYDKQTYTFKCGSFMVYGNECDCMPGASLGRIPVGTLQKVYRAPVELSKFEEILTKPKGFVDYKRLRRGDMVHATGVKAETTRKELWGVIWSVGPFREGLPHPYDSGTEVWAIWSDSEQDAFWDFTKAEYYNFDAVSLTKEGKLTTMGKHHHPDVKYEILRRGIHRPGGEP